MFLFIEINPAALVVSLLNFWGKYIINTEIIYLKHDQLIVLVQIHILIYQNCCYFPENIIEIEYTSAEKYFFCMLNKRKRNN